jgi:hypothetical protein
MRAAFVSECLLFDEAIGRDRVGTVFLGSLAVLFDTPLPFLSNIAHHGTPVQVSERRRCAVGARAGQLCSNAPRAAPQDVHFIDFFGTLKLKGSFVAHASGWLWKGHPASIALKNAICYAAFLRA